MKYMPIFIYKYGCRNFCSFCFFVEVPNGSTYYTVDGQFPEAEVSLKIEKLTNNW